MLLEPLEAEGALVVRVCEPRIDAVNAIRFKDSLRDLTGKAPERVVLDMSGVDFVDSSGLGAVVASMKMLAPERRLELAELSDPVARVFRLTRMDKVFSIHDRAPVGDAARLVDGVAGDGG